MTTLQRTWRTVAALAMAAVLTGAGPKIGEKPERQGDEIVVCGEYFHARTPVVLWTDPGGYDAYRVERPSAPLDKASPRETSPTKEVSSPNRYGMRTRGLPPEVLERVRGGGWDLPTLQSVVDQFVIHFDARGTSQRCFQVLNARGLSVHFMLDVDGTIYQTLDLKESAWHATIANSRSVGIEIANVGAYPTRPAPGGENDVLAQWYAKDPDGQTRLTIPGGVEKSGVRHKSMSLRPARPEPVIGEIQGQTLRQYDLTPQQYESLTKLTAALCKVFPKIACDYPRDAEGKLIPRKLPDAALRDYQGILGHYHVQTNKVDPGPAFQWDTVINGARGLMGK